MVKRRNHVLVTVGCIGNKRAYLDVTEDEAIRRFKLSDDYIGDDSMHVSSFEFEDEFWTYGASSLEER